MAADVEVRAVIEEDRTLSGTFTTDDGVALEDGNRVLAAGQTAATERDFYLVDDSGPWTRDTATPLSQWVDILVLEGDENAGARWTLSTAEGSGYVRDGSAPLHFEAAYKLPRRTIGEGLEESPTGAVKLPQRAGVAGDWSAPGIDLSLTDRGIVTDIDVSIYRETFIDGLALFYQELGGISFTKIGMGQAYVPGLNKVVLQASNPLGRGYLTPGSSLGYLYITETNGVLAVFDDTIPPDDPYLGTARLHPSDENARYIGSIRTDSGGIVFPHRHDPKSGLYRYLVDSTASPFRVVSGGTAQTNQTVGLGTVVGTDGTAKKLVAVGTRFAFLRVTVNANAAVGLSNSQASIAASAGGIEAVTTAQRGTNVIMPLDDNLCFTWANQAASGSTNIDLLGFWLVR